MGRFRHQCAKFAILIVFVSYAVMATYVETPKSAKRRGISLFRVGKRYGDSFYPWNIQTEEKRLKTLVTFPRIGRSPEQATSGGAIGAAFDDPEGKRSDANGQNGMWFGPRIGRTLHDDEPGSMAPSSGTSPWITAVRDAQEKSRKPSSSPYNDGYLLEYLDYD
ncbi:unnamed protein product [Acanthoscelides obtectus]|uniref:Uncharacterized protein n=1 Tax=Acanthoscelides obtectus TaxID=200917 RepID=A0A9P0K1Z3_ACAOB|nr:unnamed protein product [Acanthoscelides obtectus]CAK1665864.1 hypothetical protein AOBTE_LOCUS25012 [Acanthoscelides obtectus]